MYKFVPVKIAKDLEDVKVLIVGICIEKGENNCFVDDGSDTIECILKEKTNVDVGDYVIVSGKNKAGKIYVDGIGKISKELYDYLLSKLPKVEEKIDESELKREVLMYIDEKGEVTLQELIENFGPKVKKIIEELLFAGEIFEPSPEVYRKI